MIDIVQAANCNCGERNQYNVGHKYVYYTYSY